MSAEPGAHGEIAGTGNRTRKLAGMLLLGQWNAHWHFEYIKTNPKLKPHLRFFLFIKQITLFAFVNTISYVSLLESLLEVYQPEVDFKPASYGMFNSGHRMPQLT